ncbi:MAG: sulfite exporter TauE/SafE family protein [Desulfuromusa sp.]|nr:sulfite exporter TauE/SafE family protein [Desulfuromusa sp.]
MDWLDYVFILTAYTVAGSIKGLTGIGFSTSFLPIMALRLDLKIAIPLVIVPSIVSNVVVMVQAGHFREAIRRFWVLYISSIPGLLIGLAILIAVSVDTAKAILGVVLISYTFWALSNKSFSLSKSLERKLKIPVGFFTGIINGLTGSQVMPVLPYMLSLNLNKNLFVQAINISFTLASLIMLFGMNTLGYISPKTFLIATLGLLPVLLTMFFTGRLRHQFSGALHRKLVLTFLLIMGIVLLARVLL